MNNKNYHIHDEQEAKILEIFESLPEEGKRLAIAKAKELAKEFPRVAATDEH